MPLNRATIAPPASDGNPRDGDREFAKNQRGRRDVSQISEVVVENFDFILSPNAHHFAPESSHNLSNTSNGLAIKRGV